MKSAENSLRKVLFDGLPKLWNLGRTMLVTSSQFKNMSAGKPARRTEVANIVAAPLNKERLFVCRDSNQI